MRSGFLFLLVASTLLCASATFAASNATVTLGNLTQSCDGSPKAVTVTTSPSGLSTSVTYNGSTTVPSSIGNYTVIATVTDPNYQGSATNTFVIRGVAATPLSNRGVCAGQSATFSTTVSGANSFTCLWRKNGVQLAGETNTAITLANVQPANAGEYSIEITGPCNSVTNAALLTISGSLTGAISFTNNSPIAISEFGAAEPYPSILNVSCLPNGFSNITVTLIGLTHDYPDDLDILLVSPAGKAAILMADCGGGVPISGVNLTFDDVALTSLPDKTLITTSTNRPTNYVADDDFWLTPAPQSGYTNGLRALRGMSPNGGWSLYIMDDNDFDGGSLEAWAITFHVEPGPVLSQLVVTNNTLQFSVRTTANRTNVVEASTNLIHWTPIYTNVPPTNSFFTTNVMSAWPRRFYRAVLYPPGN
jgi:large repetitive protein